jgi:hypothetical protein
MEQVKARLGRKFTKRAIDFGSVKRYALNSKITNLVESRLLLEV